MGEVINADKQQSESVVFSRLLYPKNSTPGYTGFMICLYRKYDPAHRSRPKSAGGTGFETFVAKGSGLPTTPKTNFVLNGNWKTGDRGPEFIVTDYELPRIESEDGIINFLTCGVFKGVSVRTARRIWRTFGTSTLDILDNNIDRLMEVPRFSERNFKKFKESYVLNMGCKRLAKICSPFNISGYQIQKFYTYYENEDEAIKALSENPYKMCTICGVNFKVADEIAKKYKLDPKMPARIREAALYALREYENIGNTCVSGKLMCESVCKICGFPINNEIRDVILEPIKVLVDKGLIVKFNGRFFRKETADIEDVLAGRICRSLKHTPNQKICNLDDEIIDVQRKLKLSFASQQVKAVQMALSNEVSFSVITGGPGTGKTLIQRAILEIFVHQHPRAKVLCCSPTGKAARRMTESTGFPAQTVHSALGLCANELGDFSNPQELDADLIVVDEVSMLDTFVAASLMDSTRNGCRVVFVGDCDQLPSVGAGCVLADLLESGRVPFVKLNAVFRQAEGSLIAVNAQGMNNGNPELRYGDDFVFIPCNNTEKSVQILIDEYLKAADELGADNVALLSPFRKSTETGVDALNKRLQAVVNPPSDSKSEVTYRDKIYREGDRVMQIKNYKNVANGDIGNITRIYEKNDEDVKELVVEVEFTDTVVEYSQEDLKMLDLAFATTIHKSQGSEYHTVILTLQMAHKRMLNRPLIYTAVTRGKKRVIIVGEKEAISKAILTNDTQKRLTCLKERINARFE